MWRVLFVLFASILLTGPASAASTFSALIDFGDSLSDVGNVYALTNGGTPGTPGYYDGRFSNGPIWVEDLGQSLGLGAPTPSLTGGNDYAYGGVTSGTGYTDLALPNIETQVDGWTATNTATPSDLFTVLGGANDLLNYLSGTGTTTPKQAADNIATSVQALYADGARNILVGNLPNLGLTPRFIGAGTAAQTASAGASVEFDTELATDLGSISSTSPGLNLYDLNLYAIFNEVVADPAAYGLTDVTDQAYTGDNNFAGNGTAVSNPSQYLFWDSIHPTTTGHALLADAALAAIPEPSGLAAVLLATAALTRRRYRDVAQASRP